MLGLHQALWTWQGLGGETKRGRDAWDLTRAPRPWIWRGCCGKTKAIRLSEGNTGKCLDNLEFVDDFRYNTKGTIHERRN